jgi:hypothetical protein
MEPKSSTSNAKPGVRVRMYRQGLGDCFLVSFFTDPAKLFHILVDCGVFRGTNEAKPMMNKVAANIKEATSPGGLDVLVATHEHWDHLSGFLQARDVFDSLNVGSVWVAWTEDPNNPVARKLKETQALRIQALTNVVTEFTNLRLGMKQGISEILGFFGDEGDLGAAGSSTTKSALDYVTSKAKVRFCMPGEPPIELNAIPGVRFYILGPPQDPVLIKQSNPSRKNSEVYESNLGLNADVAFLAATQPNYEAVVADESDRDRQWRSFPFDKSYRVSIEEAKQPGFCSSTYFDARSDYRKIDNDWLNWSEQLALNLDSDTNNTSLAFAIELPKSQKVILFPADAQVGNWLSWSSLSWKVKDADGLTRAVTSVDLLNRTALYKVGHHGSHNATLREKGLELMNSPDLVAMIPVNTVFAQAAPRHWKMPFSPLYDRLSEKCKGRVLQADKTWPGSEDLKPDALSTIEWQQFRDSVQLDPTGLFIDFIVGD